MAKHAFYPGVHIATIVPIAPIADQTFAISLAANSDHITAPVVRLERHLAKLTNTRQLVSTQVAFLLLLRISVRCYRTGG